MQLVCRMPQASTEELRRRQKVDFRAPCYLGALHCPESPVTQGSWFQNPYLERMWKPETSQVGYLEPLGPLLYIGYAKLELLPGILGLIPNHAIQGAYLCFL